MSHCQYDPGSMMPTWFHQPANMAASTFWLLSLRRSLWSERFLPSENILRRDHHRASKITNRDPPQDEREREAHSPGLAGLESPAWKPPDSTWFHLIPPDSTWWPGFSRHLIAPAADMRAKTLVWFGWLSWWRIEVSQAHSMVSTSSAAASSPPANPLEAPQPLSALFTSSLLPGLDKTSSQSSVDAIEKQINTNDSNDSIVRTAGRASK